MHRFKELDVWKTSVELVKTIYEMTAKYPRTELFGLISQIRRSAVSIPSNIAEGGRKKY
jgi:four helix bundle protein